MSVPSSLEDVLQRIRNDPELSQRERQDMSWAVRGVGRVLNRSLRDVPASPSVLSNRLSAFEPSAAGMSKATWSNLRSHLRSALNRTGCYVQPGRHKAPLTSAWKTLLDRVEDRNLRYGLSRFLHFASERGWEPGDIGDEHFDAFLDALENHSISKNPLRAHRRACMHWNQAVRRVPGWPQTPVSMPRHDNGYTYAWADFPDSLSAAVTDYFEARQRFDPFTRSNLTPLAPLSVDRQSFQLRQVASAIVRKGEASPEHLDCLEALVQPERAKAAFRFFYERSGNQRSKQLTQIANALLGAARYLLTEGKLDQATFDRLYETYKRVEYRDVGLTDRNKERLRPFGDPVNVAKLIHLPDQLAAQCARHEATLRDAYRMRTALAVEILLVFPIRLRNLVTLRIDQHVYRTRADGNGRTYLYVPGLEVKNGEALQVELPDRTARLLQSYILHYRPLLVRDNEDWLFPGANGGHQHTGAFGTYLKKRIARETGLVVHPHLFRHLAAKLYLKENPGQFEVVRKVLGHRRLKTTVDTYAEFDSHQAVQLYDDHILALRGELTHA
jgi:integrase